MDKISRLKEGVYLIANNTKKGVLNAAGNPILPLDFDQIQVENKDFFIVTKDKLSGIMRANGDTFLSLKYSEVAIDWEEQKVFVKGMIQVEEPALALPILPAKRKKGE